MLTTFCCSCHMSIPGTQYSLVKKTMYSADTDLARARRVSGAGRGRYYLHYIYSVSTVSTEMMY